MRWPTPPADNFTSNAERILRPAAQACSKCCLRCCCWHTCFTGPQRERRQATGAGRKLQLRWSSKNSKKSKEVEQENKDEDKVSKTVGDEDGDAGSSRSSGSKLSPINEALGSSFPMSEHPLLQYKLVSLVGALLLDRGTLHCMLAYRLHIAAGVLRLHLAKRPMAAFRQSCKQSCLPLVNTLMLSAFCRAATDSGCMPQ